MKFDKDGLANAMVKQMVEMMPAMVDNAKQLLGPMPGREPVSLDKQLEAYQQMTAQDMEILTMKHGPAEMERYFAAMEKALRRRREYANQQAAR